MKKVLAILLALMMTASMMTVAVAEEKVLDVWYSCFVPTEERELPEEEWTINKIAREFEALNPGVKINMIYQADQQVAQNKLKGSVLAGDAPDLINMFMGYFVYSVKDALMDVGDLIPEEDKAALIGWDGAAAGDELYGYPVGAKEACALMYNKELVAKAGVDLEGEGAPKNAAELMAAFEKIKEAGIQPFIAGAGGYNSLYVFIFSSFWSQISGVQGILSDSLGETKFSEDEGFLKSIQFMRDMYDKGLLNVDYETKTDSYQNFLNGECAFYATTVLSNDDVSYFGDNLGIYMLPDYDETVAYPGYQIGGAGQVMCVVQGCEEPELAVQFMSFISNKQNTIQLVRSGLPLRNDISPEELGQAGVPVYERYIELSNNHSFNWNDNTMQSDVCNEFYSMSTMAIVGQMSVEELAEELDIIAEDVAANS